MNLDDPMKEWAEEQAKKFKNSRADCPMLQMALWLPDSGFPKPSINVLKVGEDGKCQCENCISFRDKMDEVIVKSLLPDSPKTNLNKGEGR